MGGVQVELRTFLTWALDGGQWSTSRSGRFIPNKEAPYPLNGWLCGPQNIFGLPEEQVSDGIRTTDHPTRNFAAMLTTHGLLAIDVNVERRKKE